MAVEVVEAWKQSKNKEMEWRILENTNCGNIDKDDYKNEGSVKQRKSSRNSYNTDISF